MHRKSPSGVPQAAVPADTREPDIALVAGVTTTLHQHALQWIVTTGNIAADATVALPLSPKEGDEVLVTSTHTGVGNLIVSGNGRNIGATPTDTLAGGVFESRWYKYLQSQNIWVTISTV